MEKHQYILNNTLKFRLTLKLKYLLLFVLVVSIGVTPAFANTVNGEGAQEVALSVTTDKTFYFDSCEDEPQHIIISGYVRNIFPDVPVTLKVVSPNGNLVSIDQLDVSEDKTFGTELGIGGAIYRTGNYTVLVEYGYGSSSLKSQSTFEYQYQKVEDGCGFGVEDYNAVLVVDGNDVSYSISGGKLISITPDVNSNSLILEIQAASDGSITIVIPRSVLDAKTGEIDSDFIVLVDGKQVSFDETTSATHRTLTIAFPNGTEQIEIIGTFVIPEFGGIVMMILVVAIISIIAVSAKSRLGMRIS